MVGDLSRCAQKLSSEARDLYLGPVVERWSRPPTALEFMRLVCQNRPMIFENAINHWPAMSQWTNDDYLCECMEGHDITLAVVPDGFADAVKPLSQTDPSLVFTLPYEDKMPFQQAMKCVKSSQRGQRVYYCQFQNNGMCDEFKPLLKEVDRDIPWATEALGYGPDAVNFWMGVEDSKTSVHKDLYENLYVVVRGEKVFTLYPPVDVFLMNRKTFPVYRYDRDMNLHPENTTVPWCRIDDPEIRAQLPQPLRVHVRAGEVLYLPSLFYHEVEQRGDCNGELCIAVNYWYDMLWDQRVCWLHFAERLISGEE